VLASINVDSLRCIELARLELGGGLNVIQGANGSGKTSLLEAIFLTGRGRSFRTRNTARLIRRGTDRLLLFAETVDPAHRVGFQYHRDDQVECRIDGRAATSLAELPGVFFVEVIDPDIHRLVEGSPAERRRWLDWGVFHVEHSFLAHWARYTRALRQRNAALKAGQNPQPWEMELVAQGTVLHEFRERWVAGLQPFWEATTQRLLGAPLTLQYRPGWPADVSLEAALAQGRARDIARGTTGDGPHRADVTLKAPAGLARDVLSRGQQKLAAAAMVLSLLGRLRADSQALPTLLLDDPAAELDADRLGSFVEVVRDLQCQLVLTSLSPDTRLFGDPERVFHVEQGRVQEVY
jgi:DNA replication and repair protein RecF